MQIFVDVEGPMGQGGVQRKGKEEPIHVGRNETG